jgi:arylsulfatase
LQAPEKWVNHYRKKLGPEQPYTGKSYFPNQSPRATYAAMISTLDEQVGDLVSVLMEQGILENTLIIFTSDNGPTYTGGVDAEFFNSAKPFKSGHGWAKGFLHEGGIRVPMIASWKNRIKQGSSTDHLSAFQDILPTVLELCGIQPPKETDGISFLNILLGEEQEDKHEYLYWEIPEYGGQQALRIDNFKAIRKNIFKGNLNIQLFDLSTDIQETKNVAEQSPEIVKQAKEIMEKEHRPSVLPGFQFPALGE